MAAIAATGSPDYGLDAPRIVRSMFSRAAWIIAVALVLYVVNHSEYPGPAARMCGVLALIGLLFLAIGAGMIWSSRVAKLRLRDRMLDSLALRGDERVLDVGCGRGLLAIGAAKRLKNGKVVGIDVWNPYDLSGNSPDAAKANVKLEGVADKVRIENGDAQKLVYPDNHYDVVVSSLVLHNIPEQDARAQAVREMFRVLKPGGKLTIFDLFRTGEYAEVLRASGAKDVELSKTSFFWWVPGRSLTARK
ncbi:MAG TPA: class I SAM-dependent methyltransferase [Bryobacteraceae bacterium]|jgi:arsenite methyltransferase|nr:class I SAM-dependent methyltransferase [Bryobacteraceae bacterium]